MSAKTVSSRAPWFKSREVIQAGWVGLAAQEQAIGVLDHVLPVLGAGQDCGRDLAVRRVVGKGPIPAGPPAWIGRAIERVLIERVQETLVP
ncbi:MAG TPA: hypothetical protein VGY66_05755 [Gemmataceae bacterium]|nr:hypothetical protein [Gemmataceae bacterium]